MYVYDDRGNPIGFRQGDYLYDMNGAPVAQVREGHVYKLSGAYVGELDEDMVVDKRLGSLGNIGSARYPPAHRETAAPRHPQELAAVGGRHPPLPGHVEPGGQAIHLDEDGG